MSRDNRDEEGKLNFDELDQEEGKEQNSEEDTREIDSNEKDDNTTHQTESEEDSDHENELLIEEKKKSPIVKYGLPLAGGLIVLGVVYIGYQKFFNTPSYTPQVSSRNNLNQNNSVVANTNNVDDLKESSVRENNEISQNNNEVGNINNSNDSNSSERISFGSGTSSNSNPNSGNNNQNDIIDPTFEDINNESINDDNNINENPSADFKLMSKNYNSLEERVEKLEEKVEINKRLKDRIDRFDNVIEDYNNRISSLEKEFKELEGSISLVQEIAKERKENKISNEGNISINVPKFAEGRQRMIGYQIVPATKDPSMVIVKDPSGELLVLTKGSDISYKGKNLFVNKINSDGKVILVDNKYFIDTIKGFGPKAETTKKIENKKVVKKSKSVSKFIPEEQRRAIEGWKGVAREGNKIVIDLGSDRSDRFITLVEGEPVKVYGRVTRIADDGTVYFANRKINFEK